jgi:hypothetical protein
MKAAQATVSRGQRRTLGVGLSWWTPPVCSCLSAYQRNDTYMKKRKGVLATSLAYHIFRFGIPVGKTRLYEEYSSTLFYQQPFQSFHVSQNMEGHLKKLKNRIDDLQTITSKAYFCI